ncbi:MAG: DUF4954 family protein [Porphyromonas sp.]|nr:DUF4954 family protein [Porphyromonas sp.]
MRNLTKKEIEVLELNLCTAQDWQRVTVSDGFSPHRCHSVRFYGDCSIGDNQGYALSPIGYEEPYGIRNATIVSCNIGNDVIIEEVADVVANYDIEDHCIIKNISKLSVEGECSFGNGIDVHVLNETGGREVRIFNELTAQVAYLLAMYRHDVELIASLNTLIDKYVKLVTSTRGRVGQYSVIKFSGKIKNVNFGPYSDVEGVTQLVNGSVNSHKKAPVKIGFNVNCQDFIIGAGSSVTDGSVIKHSFIGQGCSFSNLFSAHDSLFFANCQGENGEACAIFAGPYTVSMHKSSLLIAGYYSFLNAGSGSNQSNHLYKLGPIHQGIVERGSKTTSDSYILWPARVGAFTLIMGRHVSHMDSTDFPFSYLIENDNKTYLVPGMNLRSVGTIRDSKKWPARDKRKDSLKLDNINFNLLSPYTVGKMYNGYNRLKELSEQCPVEKEYSQDGMYLRSSVVARGMEFYRLGIEKFLGNSLIQRLSSISFSNEEELFHSLAPNTNVESTDWLDLCGMLAPRKVVSELLRDVKNGFIPSIDELNSRIRVIHENYYELEWPWAYALLLQWNGVEQKDLTVPLLIEFATKWIEAVSKLDNLLYEDAKKEFEMFAQVGFGIDLLNKERKLSDFEQVRGTFEENSFVCEVLSHIERKRKLYEETLDKLNGIQANS